MPIEQNGKVVCPSASAYVVLEVTERGYVVEHSCDFGHYWKLELPYEVGHGPKPKVGEEVGVSMWLTLAAKEKRRKAKSKAYG
jgi:hypothetical protein